VVVPYITFCIGRKYEEVRSLNTSMITIKNNKAPVEDFLNYTYVIDGDTIRFLNGKAESEFETIFGKPEIFGRPTVADINGDKVDDGVFFMINRTSGTGIFFYVVSSASKNSIFIGDRISPQNINVDKGLIRVNYVTRGEDEPFSAEPSVGVTKYLKVINGELVEVKAQAR
jgi:hypothetical protein